MPTRRHYLQTLLTAWAGGALLSAGRRAEAADDPTTALKAILERVRTKHELPALASVIVLQGKLFAGGATGVRKLGDPTPVTDKDQFHLGSCTKSLTATLAAICVEQKRITWETTIADVLAKAVPKIHEDLKPVTLSQLCCHWSGVTVRNSPEGTTLGQLYENGTLKGSPREQRRRFCQLILAEAPESKPGSQFAYSNLNYTIAGHMLESVLGQEWERLLKERIAQPLQMASLGYGAMGRAGKIDQPWQHRIIDDKVTPIEPGPRSDNPAVLGPGGTVHCTPADWGRYLMAHVDGEQGLAPLLSRESWERLHSAPYGGESGFGWFRSERRWAGPSRRVYNHAGTNNMNYAVVWLAPERRLAIGTLTNQGGDKAKQAVDDVAVDVINTLLPSA